MVSADLCAWPLQSFGLVRACMQRKRTHEAAQATASERQACLQHPLLSGTAASQEEMAKVEVIGDELVYSKYLSLYDRKVKVTKPNGEVRVPASCA